MTPSERRPRAPRTGVIDRSAAPVSCCLVDFGLREAARRFRRGRLPSTRIQPTSRHAKVRFRPGADLGGHWRVCVKWRVLLIVSLSGFALAGCMPWPTRITPAVIGVVLDASTGSPVSGASVHIEEFPERTATTNPNGEFTIKAIRKWEILTPADFAGDRRPAYRLIATAQGFQGGSRVWYIGDDGLQIVKLQH